jgi:hypothetical protein
MRRVSNRADDRAKEEPQCQLPRLLPRFRLIQDDRGDGRKPQELSVSLRFSRHKDE